MQEAFLQIAPGGQPGEDDQAAVVVGQIDAVVAVVQHEGCRRLLGEHLQVVFDVFGLKDLVAVRDASVGEGVGGAGVGGQDDSTSVSGDDVGDPRADLGRCGRQVTGQLRETEQPAAGALLLPALGDRDALDPAPSEDAFQFAAGAECGAHVDTAGRVVEGGVEQRGRDQRPDQQSTVGQIDHALVEVALQEPQRIHRLATDLVRGRGGGQDLLKVPGLGGHPQRRSEVDAVAVLAVRSVCTEPRNDQRVKGTSQRGEHVVVGALFVTADLQAPRPGHVPLGGMRVVEQQHLRVVECRVGVEYVAVDADGDGVCRGVAAAVRRIPRADLADQQDVEDAVLGELLCGLLRELPGRTQVGDAFSGRATPVLANEAPDQRLACTGRQLNGDVWIVEMVGVPRPQDITLVQPQSLWTIVDERQLSVELLWVSGSHGRAGRAFERHVLCSFRLWLAASPVATTSAV